MSRQAVELNDLLKQKVDIVRTSLREVNRMHIQRFIDSQKEEINRLSKIDNQNDLIKKATQLKASIPFQLRSTNKMIYNGEALQQLNENIIKLDELIDTNVAILKRRIDETNRINTIQSIKKRLITLETTLKNKPNHLNDIKATKVFTDRVKNEIANIEQIINDNLQILDKDHIVQFDDRVKNLITSNKQVYESKRDQFKNENDNIKTIITNELNAKRRELDECNYIRNNKKKQVKILENTLVLK